MKIQGITYTPTGGLLQLTTSGAAAGWAPGVGADTARLLTEVYGPVVVDGSVWERDRLWRACREAGRAAGLTPASWGHVDIALWDLFAKAQELPLFRAVGGFRDRIPVVRRGSETTDPETVTAEAVAARDEGAWGYSLSLASAETAMALLPSLRQAVGPGFRLLCDGGQRLDLEQALRIGRSLEAIEGHWFAEPVRDGDLVALQKLSDALELPVVAGAFIGDSILAGTRALTTRAVDRVRVTLPDTGGFTEALKLARGAEALQMNCEVDWGPACGPYAAAHLMGAVRNAELLVLPTQTPAAPGWAPMAVADGYLQLPDAPGLGLQPVDEAVAGEDAS
jgi:L-alanine-DL-glutamate epimerase-like enolase superfamily enzyme